MGFKDILILVGFLGVTTTNEANMRQMMRCEADLSIPVERLVVNELETDPITDGSFKCLELSGTRSCMLLETQIFKDSATTFKWVTLLHHIIAVVVVVT